MVINEEGLAIVKKWETLQLKAYLCPANIPTIGYGHTKDVKLGDTITEEQADNLLSEDLEQAEEGVEKLLQGTEYGSNQFSALVSFAFNLGVPALAASGLLKHFRQGHAYYAAQEFDKWVHAKTSAGFVVLPGLVKRRKDERALFLKPDSL